MKNTVVRFKLYNITFQSRPVTRETAEEMARQLHDRDIKDASIETAVPRAVYVIAGVDRGEGHHRLDTAGLQAYFDMEVAQEDLNRFLFKSGMAVLPLTVLHEPHLLGTKEQRDAWEAKKKA